MGRRVSHAVVLALVVSGALAASVRADITTNLVGYWPLDGNALDASGSGHHGAMHGPIGIVADRQGNAASALRFPNDVSAYIDLGQPPELLIKGAMTVAAWVRADTLDQDGRIIAKQGGSSGRSWGLNIEPGRLAQFDLGTAPKDRVQVRSPALSFGPTEWFHLTGLFRPGESAELYLNGALAKKEPTTVTVQWLENDLPINIGRRPQPATPWRGDIDEVRMYARALSPEDVMELVFGQPGVATDPAPANQATDVPVDAVLSWTPGPFAASHDIYLGTSFQEVTEASAAKPLGVLVRAGQEATTCDPGPLVFGTTYYWRIDEVNQAPDHAIYQGNVWSFTTESYGYPVMPVAATTSDFQPGMEPEKTIDGSGLTGDLHGTESTTMWMTTGAQPAWIQYEFGKVYKLHELWVWNSNQPMEAFVGFGARKVTIETSLDGTMWAPVADVPEFNKAPGAAGYAANTTVGLGDIQAKYVKLTIAMNWNGATPQTGLAEVRFFYVPVQAWMAEPADAATGVSVEASLDWRPGREATSHKVYFGTDADGVAKGTVAAQTQAKHGYVPAALNYGTTYYWKVDEIGAATYPGDLWSFTTREYQVLDDFESYTDQEGHAIFQTWADGLENPANGGSLVGNDPPPYAEQTIIHGGRQSMPLLYNNTAGITYSEATRTFDTPQNWTAHGIKSLSLWFRGVADNTGRLYVKINSTKLLYDGDAGDLARAVWQVWNIDLAKAGNVNSVRTLTIGIEGAGTKGTLYIDDVRLYPRMPEYIIPVQPAKGPVAYYPLDGDYKDASGNGRNGTAASAPTFAAGQKGQAVSLDGDGDYITINNWQGILGGNPFTISLWVNSTAQDDRTLVCWGTNIDRQRVDFRLYQGRLRVEHGSGNLQGNTVVADGQWHPAALVVTQDAPLQYPQVALYVDGLNDTQTTTTPATFGIVANVPVTIGQRRTSNDRNFQGLLDEVRIFDVALSAEEVAALSGRTMPMAKPF